MPYLSAIIEDDQLEALERLRDKKHAEYPEFQISLSSVVRSVLNEGLKVIEQRQET